MIAVLAFVSCSEEQEELQIVPESIDLNSIVENFEQSSYFEHSKNNGLEVRLDSYQFEETNDIKMILFDVQNQQMNNNKTKVVALIGFNGKITNSFSITTTRPFSENYSGDAIIDLYNGEVVDVSFKDGQALDFQIYNGAMRMMPNGDPTIEGDGGGIGEDNGDDPIAQGNCSRNLGNCVGNTLLAMAPVEQAFCFIDFPICMAVTTADCLLAGCPFDGV